MNWIISLIIHIIFSIPLYLLAKKANYKYPIFAFIPILSFILMLNIAEMSGWYILLILVPIVNILFGIYFIYEFYTSYESGFIVFIITLISAVIGIILPLAVLIGTIAHFWLAFSSKKFIGRVY